MVKASQLDFRKAPYMNPEVTQPSLLSRVRDPSDQQAWAHFEAKYRELILRYCRRRGLQQADAEDVRQMTMMRLVRTLPQFMYDPERGRFRDYLYRVVKSAMNDVRSRPKSALTAVVPDDLEALRAPQAPDDGLWEQEWVDHHYRMAMAAVRASFEPTSVAVFERLLAGDTVEAVSQQFAMTPAAVHKVKQRVRDRLSALIESQTHEEDDVGA
jgi:RNA polymerase sigma-70 factor (ECF subfamily)